MPLRLVTAGAAAAVTALLAFHSGGYFPSEWGIQIGFFAVVSLVVVIVFDVVAVSSRDVVVVAALALLAVWSLVSIAWSSGADAPVLSSERVLVYVAALSALLLLVSLDRVEWLVGGVAAGIVVVCMYALGTRLLAGSLGDPADTLTGRRLDAPIGYANALGVLAALGVVLALGFVFHDRIELRIWASAALVPLSVTLYFTLSRGSLIALAAGLLAFVVVDRGGSAIGGMLLVAIPSAAGVFLAVRSPLLDGGLSIAAARSSGHRLAWELGLLAVAGGATGAVAGPLSRRFTPLAWITIGGGAAFGAAAVIWIGPGDIAHRAAASFRALPPATTGHPTRRLLSASTSWRSEYWRVAWRMVEREPLLGDGAGSYERWWLQERQVASDARNAHNLFLETLAELGPVGLALLAIALGAPLLAPARRTPIVAAAFAAYVIWLVHALLDWDWQIPGVTLVGLSCAAAVLVSARSPAADGRLTLRVRLAGSALLIPLLAAGLVVHVGNRAADRSQTALDAGRLAGAASDARRARTWMPWAAQPWQLLGEAQLAAEQEALARVSLHHAIARDADDWSVWYDLTSVEHGAARADALARARRLNPLATELGDSG